MIIKTTKCNTSDKCIGNDTHLDSGNLRQTMITTTKRATMATIAITKTDCLR